MAETKAEPSTQTTNPLTKKLNKILETRFDNDRVRNRAFSYLTFSWRMYFDSPATFRVILI